LWDDKEHGNQYDAWNRLVQVNEAFFDTSIEPDAWAPVPDRLLKHNTYDALGRLIRTQSPYPNPEEETGLVRTERFYYDGVRRIQEVVVDPVYSGGEAAMSGDPALESLAAEAEGNSPTPTDGSTSPVVIEEGQMNPESGGNGAPPPVVTTLAREYVWGPGDNGLDELWVYYDEDRNPSWGLMDGGGDLVGVCDTDPVSGYGRVAAQWAFDAYGQVIALDEVVPGYALPHLGHKGLFVDRLDKGVVESDGSGGWRETRRIVLFADVVCQDRNRIYLPGLGRFGQADPNATALTLLAESSFGSGTSALVATLQLDGMYGDGGNLYEYLGSSPLGRSDPMGLFFGADAGWGSSGGNDPFSMVDEYIAEDMGAKSAFLSGITSDVRTAVYLGTYITSMLPIPVIGDAAAIAFEFMDEPESLSRNAWWYNLKMGQQEVANFLHMMGQARDMAFEAAWSYAQQGAQWAYRKIRAGTDYLGVDTDAMLAGTAFGAWIKKGDSVHVYVLYNKGKPVYVGISNNPDRRSLEHGARGVPFDEYEVVTRNTGPLNRNRARAIETKLMDSHSLRGTRWQRIRSLSPRRLIWGEAMDFAVDWIRKNASHLAK